MNKSVCLCDLSHDNGAKEIKSERSQQTLENEDIMRKTNMFFQCVLQMAFVQETPFRNRFLFKTSI